MSLRSFDTSLRFFFFNQIMQYPETPGLVTVFLRSMACMTRKQLPLPFFQLWRHWCLSNVIFISHIKLYCCILIYEKMNINAEDNMMQKYAKSYILYQLFVCDILCNAVQRYSMVVYKNWNILWYSSSQMAKWWCDTISMDAHGRRSNRGILLEDRARAQKQMRMVLLLVTALRCWWKSPNNVGSSDHLDIPTIFKTGTCLEKWTSRMTPLKGPK